MTRQRRIAKGVEGLPVGKGDQVGEGVRQGRRHDRRRWWVRCVGMRLGPDLLLLAPLGPSILKPDLYPCLRQADLHGKLLPRKHIRVMRPGEGFFELFQLKAGKGRSVTALFSLGREVVGLRFALGASRRRSRMSAFFLGPHLLRGDAHLGRLGRRRRR